MILLVGIAGSGKGTQGKLLADKYGYHLITMGDIIRMHVTGEKRRRMLNGELLDDQDVIELLDKTLNTLQDDNQVVLDGFPRTLGQSEWLMQQVKAGRFGLDYVLHLMADRELVKSRLANRNRPDDVEQTIENRFNLYEQTTAPVLEWLKEQGAHVVTINAEQPVEKVQADILEQVKSS